MWLSLVAFATINYIQQLKVGTSIGQSLVHAYLSAKIHEIV